MPLSKFCPMVTAIEYDGANSAEILSLIPPYRGDSPPTYPTILSETGGVLTFQLDSPGAGLIVLPVHIGGWVVIPADTELTGLVNVRMYDVATNPLLDFYAPILDSEEIAGELLADESFIEALLAEVPDPALPVLHYQVARVALPALLLGGTTSPVAVFDAAMPDTGYEIRWRAVAGAAILSSIVANGAVTKTTTQVTIPLRAQGLASVAGVLLVEVFKLAAS